MVDSLATVALETLRDLLIDEAKFLAGVSNQVKEAEKQLKTMHSLLQDVDRRQEKSKRVLNWVKELRDLSMEAENVLETYDIEVTSKREGKDLKSKLKRFTCILGECVSMHETGTQIGRIRSRMDKLTNKAEAMIKGASSSGPVDEVQWSSRITYGDEFEEHFVGMEKDIKLLESLITSDVRSNQVISICGMGGLGKTTLATKVYNMEAVKSCFEACVWICISQKFNREAVLRELLKELDPMGGAQTEGQIVRKLKAVQREKRCLVVLDDIWQVDDWDSLRCAFPIGEERCKVLLTTRNERIAATERVCKLEGLSEDEGWELLQKIALPINYTEELPTNELELLEEIGREIVRKSGYLPLSVSVIGGTLRQEKSRSKWEKVCKNINSYIQRGEGVELNKKVTQILDLSYNVLPYNLKSCFLYLGCFPEDQEIQTEQLYLLWMGEGMISSEDRGRGETLKDVAERYLSELSIRCMVQVKMNEESINNRFKSCRLHDLMRDLCLSRGKEEGFLEVVDIDQMERRDASSVRRLVVHSNIQGEDYQLHQYPHVRSLLFTRKNSACRYPDINLDSTNFGMFKSLKILIVESYEFKNGQLPEGIGELMLLKHLSIEDSEVSELPTSICKLPRLQSLNLRTKLGIRLPNSIYKIRHLRHLYLTFRTIVIGGEKLKLDGLNKLETMVGFKDSDDDIADLIRLHKLRVFHGFISDAGKLSLIVDHILNHQDQFRDTDLYICRECNLNSEADVAGANLLSKTLMCHSLSRLEIYCRLNKLPSYEPGKLGKNLLSLKLQSSYIEEDPMEMLEKLPTLQKLELSQAYMGKDMVCQANGFPQLRRLDLWGLSNLVEWRVEEKAMPNLSFLSIRGCKKLEMIPDGLKFITTLKHLSISYMPNKFNDRIRITDGQAGEDYDKVKHIPSIMIGNY